MLAVPWTETLMVGCPGGTSNSVLVTGSSIDTVRVAPLGRLGLFEPAMASIEARARASPTTSERVMRTLRSISRMSIPRRVRLRFRREGHGRHTVFFPAPPLLARATRTGRELDLDGQRARPHLRLQPHVAES